MKAGGSTTFPWPRLATFVANRDNALSHQKSGPSRQPDAMHKHYGTAFMKRILTGALCLLANLTVIAQESPQAPADMYDLSLEELMNIPIHSASKKEETVFDAPLSSHTLTRSEIEKSGATSIMEALRLVPGLIVREQSNGVYDIHIRGLDNILRNSGAFTKNNLYTLVMIDSRPAFNHNLGGTFWEALPVDLLDVERIEVVRGPSAPLFGPNAVTGVVNIITRRAESSKPVVSANVQAGAPKTLIANAFVGKQLTRNLNAALSFNYQDRNRFDEFFFNNANGAYAMGSTFITNFDKGFPDPGQSMEKMGVNGYLNYAPFERAKIDVSVGFQDNTSLRNMLASYNTILNTTTSRSFYANVAAKIGDLHIRTSHVSGKDNILFGSSPSTYDFKVGDINAEYHFRISKKISVVPGINLQNAVFNDEDYLGETGKAFLNGTEQSISTVSGFVRSDVNINDQWRIIAALRADRFSSPDDLYIAYEFASTYMLNDNHLVRLAVTRSNSGAFIGYNKLNLVARNEFSVGGMFSIDQLQQGNESLGLLTVDMIEAGYRSKISANLQLDMDVFRQEISNLTTTIIRGFTQYPPTPASDFLIEFDNVPTTATQYGATFGINFVPNSQWQLKPFITVQTTGTRDLPDSYFDPSLSGTQPGMGFPPVTYTDSRHAYTPGAYGGFYLNYKPNDKLNINLNGYFMSGQTWYREGGITVNGGSTVLVNARVSYTLTPFLSIFANGRNLLDRENPQFLGGDYLGALYTGGVQLELK